MTGITAYDLRYIETSGDETADANWTLREDIWEDGDGDLEFTLAGLTNDTGYDVQIRTVTDQEGDWSATATGTPRIPAPAIQSVLAGDRALTVTWTAPAVSDTTDISAYDMRYKETKTTAWIDEAGIWTSATGGPRRFVLAGLANSYGIRRAGTGRSRGWRGRRRLVSDVLGFARRARRHVGRGHDPPVEHHHGRVHRLGEPTGTTTGWCWPRRPAS